MESQEVIAQAVSPQGRTVEITASVWAYVQKHHGMEGALHLVCLAISRPDVQAQDPRPGRERYWLRTLPPFPFPWLRAVVQFYGETDRLVTAFGEDRNPDPFARMTITIGTQQFEHVDYDEASDVLYLTAGVPRVPAGSHGTPEGHNVRYDEGGTVIGLTLVNVKWLLERDGEIKITIPSSLSAETLAPALD
ncbi:MAG: hypothetical protein QOJ97_2860 [Solirubrobacteraceae bacterium]|nr:hypothetical protein [Solirubrobacteraceae bacterium]